mgnify:CR=1 FL=1
MNREPSQTSAKCPACTPTSVLKLRTLAGQTLSMLDCPKCHGMWVSLATLHQILEQQSKSSSLSKPRTSKTNGAMPTKAETGTGTPLDSVPKSNGGYRPCVECEGLMSRRKFGRGATSVVVDACGRHGIWFDADEYEQLVRIASGDSRESTRDGLAQLANTPDKLRQRRGRRQAEFSRSATRASMSGNDLNDESAFGRSLHIFSNLASCGDPVVSIITAWF